MKTLVLFGSLISALPMAQADTGIDSRRHDIPVVISSSFSTTAIPEPPPIPCFETPPTPPGMDYCWISGHWMWDHNRWIWKNGGWERRPFSGAIWEPGCWRLRADGYVWTEGRWKTHENQPVPSQARSSDVIVLQEPPPPYSESIPSSPGPDYVWFRGHWAWQDRWVWIHGRYEQRPQWAEGRWDRTPTGWVWIEGRWY